MLAAFVCAGVLASSAGAVPDATLWVVQPPGEIVAFDLARFERVGGIRVPPILFRNPSRMNINGKGQILGRLDEQHLWLWDGSSERVLPVVPVGDGMQPRSPGRLPDRSPQWLLGDDGHSLVEMESVALAPTTPGGQAESLIVLLTTSLAQEPRDTIGVLPLHSSQCHIPLITETEPCPLPQLWASGGVARGSLAVDWWERDSTIWHEQGTPMRGRHCLSRFTSADSGWRETRDWGGDTLPLDLASDGTVLVPVRDDACCGWSNECSDALICVTPDTSMTVFDEWRRFRNSHWDVSFFVAVARLSPARSLVAMDVVATSPATREIPPSGEGHPDSLGLPTIRRELARLPLVVVTSVEAEPRTLLEVPHAEIIGWADEQELIVVQERRVVAIEVATGKKRDPGIRVRSVLDAIVAAK